MKKLFTFLLISVTSSSFAEGRRVKISCRGTLSESGSAGIAYISRYDQDEAFALAASGPDHDGGWLTDIIEDKAFTYHSREKLHEEPSEGEEFSLRDVRVDLNEESGSVTRVFYRREASEDIALEERPYARLSNCQRRAH
jgi:hypothetical protein